VVQEDRLSAVLSEFARTLITDFPIQGILDHLVRRIVEVLPITAAGVTLITDGKAPRYVAASDDSALRYEQLQTEVGQGPCLLAYESGEAVAVADLATDDRFPKFAPPALEAGLAAVFTFPIRQGDGRLGALDLYRDTPGSMGPDDMAAAQTLADVAAAYLFNAQVREEARVTSEHFHHTAVHDSLTGLPNRLLLHQRLQHAAQRAQRTRSSAAILFVDLDLFKRVNDTHGHQVGDELLVDVARRLTSVTRPGDTLARVSGDEFVFLCEDLHDATDAEILAGRIVASFSDPFVVGDVELVITASVGIAFTGPGVEISDQLVVDADVAMYQAKRKGGASHQTLDLREALQASDSNGLEIDLRAALTRDKLDVAYQPIVRTSDGHVTGVEALLRVAERSKLIDGIGGWVLERSCRDRARWLHNHPDSPLDLAVNVSARQLMSQDFYGRVVGVLDRTGMDPAALVLEMTENIFVEDNERAMTLLSDLKKLGIRIALDDFGTGYSSLSYLRRMPIDIVKIDQGFIADIGLNPSGAAIVEAVTNLAHVLGLTVIAEGVETARQRDAVHALGCDFAQGYLYARPQSATWIESRLDAEPSGQLRLAVAAA
jgi:diguanylate cyclase (GGDEF)-like protein